MTDTLDQHVRRLVVEVIETGPPPPPYAVIESLRPGRLSAEDGHPRLRRSRLAASLAAAMIVAAAAVALAVGLSSSGGSKSVVASGPRASSSAGVEVNLPQGWTDLTRPNDSTPRETLVVGTAARPKTDPIQVCDTPSGSVFVSVYEEPASPPYWAPGHTATTGFLDPTTFHPRSTPFSSTFLGDVENLNAKCGGSNPTGFSGGLNAPGRPPLYDPTVPDRVEMFLFSDSNRLFVAQVQAHDDPSGKLMQSGLAVLDSLRVRPDSTSSTPAT